MYIEVYFLITCKSGFSGYVGYSVLKSELSATAFRDVMPCTSVDKLILASRGSSVTLVLYTRLGRYTVLDFRILQS